MNLPGIRTAMKAADEAIGQNVAAVESALSEFAAEIPLKGLNVQRMHDIEEKGVSLCRQRLADLQAEIQRLEGEAKNTAAIIEAGVLKLDTLKKYLGDKPQVESLNATAEGISGGQA